MPALNVRQPRFTYRTCRLFTKHRGRIQKSIETGTLIHIYENEQSQACFAHDAGYSDSKDLAKGTISDKILKDGDYEFAIIPKYDGY